MNAEVNRIRKNRNLGDEMPSKIARIDANLLSKKMYELNTNMSYLYCIRNNPMANVNDYIEKIIANIYLVLDMFNDMGIYPDYFYDIIVKMNIEYRNLVHDGNIRGDYGLYQINKFSVKISQLIKEGLGNDKFQLDLDKSKDISECFVEMISFFERFNMKYNNNTVLGCQKSFNDIYYNINNIINNTLNTSDFIFVDIECLCRILFEYISFFVAIGVNPQKYLDEYIDNKEVLGKSK